MFSLGRSLWVTCASSLALGANTDVNASTIADGTQTIEQVGWQLFHLMLDPASGRRKTWAHQWELHNALLLFNPAPVT